jgi:hypothetical protein
MSWLDRVDAVWPAQHHCFAVEHDEETPVGASDSETKPRPPPLPPKPLPYPSPSFFKTLLPSTIKAVVIPYSIGLAVVNLVKRPRSFDLADGLCEYQTATSLERQFLIDVHVGTGLSFAQAKFVDLAWDVVVGQGGRFLHGWYLGRHVIGAVTTALMEGEDGMPSFGSFVTLAFGSVSAEGLFALWGVFWKAWKRLETSTWWMPLVLVFAVSYALFFATLLNAATGYLSVSERMYHMPDGSISNLLLTRHASQAIGRPASSRWAHLSRAS